MARLSNELIEMIGILRALNLAYHHAHVNASGQNYYADHQLLQRLYFGEANDGAPILEIDSVMERLRGLDPEAPMDPQAVAAWTSQLLGEKFARGVNWRGLIELEVELEKLIAGLGEAVESGKVQVAPYLRDGLINLLQDIADKHETNIYLIQQRLAQGSAPALNAPPSAPPPAQTGGRRDRRGTGQRRFGARPRRRRRLMGPGSGPNPFCPYRDY